MSRKTARETAMKMLYGKDFGCDDPYDVVLEISGVEVEAEQSDIDFAESLITGVLEHKDEIDSIIADKSAGWSTDRMPKVDLSVLRIAVYELLFDKSAPKKVIINEAVRIATRYGGDNSPKFVNGVLGNIVRSNAVK